MIFNKLLDFFPPPEFLDLPYAGISISDTHIRCIKFKKHNDMLVVAAYKEESLPIGTVIDGQIQNTAAVQSILEEFRKELRLEFVRVSLPEEKAYLFTMKLPIIPERDVRNAIEFRIEDNVPLPATELQFDYELIHPEKAIDHLDVVVSAIPTSIVSMYADLIRSAGMTILSLEIVSQAIARAVISATIPETVLILHFNKEKVGLYVVSDRVVQFTSTVSIAPVVENAEDGLLQEMQKLYAYWDTLKKNIDHPDKKIGSILMCGDEAKDDLIQKIKERYGAVTAANVWSNVCDINKAVLPIPFSESSRYAASIGLALPSEVLT